MPKEWTHVRMKRKLKEEVDKKVEKLKNKEYITSTGYIDRAVRNALDEVTAQ